MQNTISTQVDSKQESLLEKFNQTKIKTVKKNILKTQSKYDNLACHTCFRTNPTSLSFGFLAKSCGGNNNKSYKLNILISRYEHVQITNVLDTIVL
jgi:hypothetical protein